MERGRSGCCNRATAYKKTSSDEKIRDFKSRVNFTSSALPVSHSSRLSDWHVKERPPEAAFLV